MNHDYVISVLIKLYKTCPFSGLTLRFIDFKGDFKLFHIDHVAPSHRGSKKKDIQEQLALNSIINLRPYKGTMHLQDERNAIDYTYTRWKSGDWPKLKNELLSGGYEDLFLISPCNISRIIELTEKLFDKTGVEIPEWFFLSKIKNNR